MQYQPTGQVQHLSTHVLFPEPDLLHNQSYYPPSLMTAMPQSSLPHSYPAHAQTHSPDSHSSPQAEWRDTPRTLYKTSPETELGDNDLLSDCDAEEDGTSWNARDRSSPLFAHSPHEEHSAEEASSTDQCSSSPAPDFQAFVSKLNADIRSKSSMFSGIAPELMPWSFQSLNQKGPNGRPSGLTQVAAKAADVTATTAPPQPQTIPRKRSMHLNHPAQPINPYQRSTTTRSQPANSYTAPVIDRAYLRRFRDAVPPQRTVCMKELLVPHAEFRFGYDPEVQASELGSPTVHDFDALEEEAVTEDPLFVGGEDEQAVSPLIHDFVENETLPEDEDAQGEADDSLFDPAGEDSYEPPVKRRRTEETRVSQPPVLRSRKPHAEVPKTRKRHLQPNLVRTNGCLYGCPLLFSTAYEARRHQEDTHGREEAYSFIKAASAAPRTPVYAKDYRFLIQITTHAMGEKLSSHIKKQLDEAIEREGEELDDRAVDTIANFARDWTKRYECPRCGASFSRLDSKKRHFEKQCR